MKEQKTNHLLEIKNLECSIEGNTILQGVNLTIKNGEVHAIMGPNGSGKSTLSYVLVRHPSYNIKKGKICFEGQDLSTLTPEQAAQAGIFLSFQYPISIPGISNIQFMKSSLNAIREQQGKPLIDAVDFLSLVKSKMVDLNMPEELLYRSINDGFSGGEKKRNEILQLSLLEPKLAILDETDSGLDIDALKTVANTINKLRSKNRAILLITHYQRLLNYIEPDFVHVLSKGKIIKSGDKTLANKLEENGYQWL